ncbi:SIMPL domain-containing protein [Acetobacter garciniae]
MFQTRPLSKRFFTFTLMAPMLLAGAHAGLAHAQTAPATTKLEISAQGSVEAPPDRLTATFRAQAQDKNVATAQQAVNAQIHQATEQASKAEGVSSAVLVYGVSETRPDKNTTLWTARQVFTLTAANGKTLLPLAGQLQGNGLILEQLDWSLSPAQRQTLFLQAEKNAIADLKKQAEAMAASLGLHVLRFEHVSVSEENSPRPMPVMFMAARAADGPATPPSSTAETQTVRAGATATVLLAP